MHNVLIFGGTFDPVHNGHLQTAKSIQKQFDFEQVLFLPCKIPLLKQKATANEQQRVCMLNLALAEQSPNYHFKLDLRELERETPSYMVTTLEDFRNQWQDQRSITLLMGLDTFYQLPQWHRWQRLLTLCNLLVIDRPGVTQEPPDEIKQILKIHLTKTGDALKQHSYGLIYRYNAGLYDLSSTNIRKRLQQGENVHQQLPNVVNQYIEENELYREHLKKP